MCAVCRAASWGPAPQDGGGKVVGLGLHLNPVGFGVRGRDCRNGRWEWGEEEGEMQRTGEGDVHWIRVTRALHVLQLHRAVPLQRKCAG